MKKGNKKAQEAIGMSFSTIFSIFLIIFFIVVAFIAVNMFLKYQKCAQIGIFIQDLQPEIDKAWNSPSSSFEFTRALPSNLEYVCFANISKSSKGTDIQEEIFRSLEVFDSETNMFFYPTEKACDSPDNIVKHINITKITELQNPYCIRIENNQITIKIEKDFNDKFVSLQ